VRFVDERAVGAGVMREWLTLLSSELFDPRNALFAVADDGVRLQPSSASFANPDCLEYFSFAGRVVALAITHDELLGVRFTEPFYKQLLGIRGAADVDEITSIDADVARNLQWLLANSIDELDLALTFALDADVFGKLETVELIPNGANVAVCDANKREYVRMVVELRTSGAIAQQLRAFTDGFYSLLPRQFVGIFSVAELELLISGEVEREKNNETDCVGVTCRLFILFRQTWMLMIGRNTRQRSVIQPIQSSCNGFGRWCAKCHKTIVNYYCNSVRTLVAIVAICC
jgi:hypothetical protein